MPGGAAISCLLWLSHPVIWARVDAGHDRSPEKSSLLFILWWSPSEWASWWNPVMLIMYSYSVKLSLYSHPRWHSFRMERFCGTPCPEGSCPSWWPWLDCKRVKEKFWCSFVVQETFTLSISLVSYVSPKIPLQKWKLLSRCERRAMKWMIAAQIWSCESETLASPFVLCLSSLLSWCIIFRS